MAAPVDGKDPLGLLKRWLETQEDLDGQAAVKFFEKTELPDEVSKKAVELLLERRNAQESAVADSVAGGLLKRSVGARKFLSARLQADKTVETYRTLWNTGDATIDGLILAILDKSAWPSEETRVSTERDAFIFSLALLMEAGLDHPDRAMKPISRLLAADAQNLTGLVDADGLDVILQYLDIREPSTVRNQATLATAKLLEASPENAQTLIRQYVTRRVMKRPDTASLSLAFSVAAAVFPMAPSIASGLFLSQGFVENFIPLVESKKSQRLNHAALELLSAACMDAKCREAIAKECTPWLQSMAMSKADRTCSSLALLVLTKIGDVKVKQEKEPLPVVVEDTDSEAEDSEDFLTSRFRAILLSSDDAGKQSSIEGLMYASRKPKVKQQLAEDKEMLKSIFKALEDPSNGSALYAGLALLANLTQYRPVMSEEQKRISELKAYANSSKPTEPDPLDKDKSVTVRCKKLLDAGVLPVLLKCSKRATATGQSLILQILLSLSKEQKHRGVMAQQGAVRYLIQVAGSLLDQAPPQASANTRIAAHALARILISTDPTHVFSSALPVASATRPLLALLTEDPSNTSQYRDFLPTFEALLALTNLASADETTRDTIMRLAWSQIEDLLLASNELVRRAAVELVCNLMQSPNGIAKFADGSKQASNRLHILLALADAEDLPTRRAASGALAVLTDFEAAVEGLLSKERGAEILLKLCAEDTDELRHRGAVCVCNAVQAEGDAGAKARERIKQENGVEVLKEMVTKSTNPAVVHTGAEALQALLQM